tara:strand:- start:331 stop:510 length:180 start_codon:yes stop_codon:yes gene_type:complete
MSKFREFIGRLALVILFIGIIFLSIAKAGIAAFLIWGGFVLICQITIDYLLAAFDDSKK